MSSQQPPSNDPIKPEDARRRVEEKRAALEASIRAVSSKIEHGADTVQRAVGKVKHVAAEGRGMVERNPWVFIAAAVGAGVVIGVATGGKKKTPIPIELAGGAGLVHVAQRRPSLIGGLFGFVGKSLLRTLTGAVLVNAERMIQEKLGIQSHDDPRS